MNPLLLTLPLLPPLGTGLWNNDGQLSHVNGWGIIAGEPVAYGWRHTPAYEALGPGYPWHYRVPGVWLADGTTIVGPSEGCVECAILDVSIDGTATIVQWGSPTSTIIPGDTLAETEVVIELDYTEMDTWQARTFTLPGFMDHVHAADVTTTGATLPGQDGFGVPDGVVNFDDLGAFQFWWMRPNE